MADTYGALQVPVQVPAAGEEVSDPAVTIIVNYLAAVLNAHAQTAWAAVQPALQGLATAPLGLAHPVVKTAQGHNPEEEAFNEQDLPALYLWRDKAKQPAYWLAEDYRVQDDVWTLLWIMRPSKQGERRLRQSFINGVYKLIDRAIESQRDPVYVAPGDTDPTAATTAAAPAAIKQAVTSSTAPQTYTGAALNGSTGGTAFAPAQLPTVTFTGTGGQGTVTFTGIGADGESCTSRVDISGAGTFSGDWSLTQVTQIDVDAQANTGSTLTFGLGGFVGRGSNVFVLGKFLRLQTDGWDEANITITMSDKSDPRHYEGLTVSFMVQERWNRDMGEAGGAQVQNTDSPDNAYVRETALLS